MSWNFEENEKVLARVRTVLSDVERVRPAQGRSESEARSAAERIVAENVEVKLGEIPLERVKHLFGAGTRWLLIESAGYRSLADVYRTSPEALTGIPGVGQSTAIEVHGVAHSIYRELAGTIRISLSPENRSPATTELLRMLWKLELRIRSRKPVVPHAALIERLERLAPPAGPATNFWSMLVTWGEARSRAENAIQELSEIIRGGPFRELEGSLYTAIVALHERSPEGQAIWADFTKRPADYYALLDRIFTQPEGETGAIRGFVPAEIVQAVERLELRQDGLRVFLRAYQSFGAKFAVVQRRTILGDEMGLGKTIQALAFIAHLKADGASHVLVVCPACVLANWEHEIAHHTTFTSTRLHGPEKELALRQWTRNGGIGLTTYDTLRSLDFDGGKQSVIVIADEAHYVKNPFTKRAQALVPLIAQGRHVLFLTGTPMENRPEEFRVLVNFLQPDVAGTLDHILGFPGARTFRRQVAPVYLRRNQEDVLHELPERIEVDDWMDMGQHDGNLYRQAVATGNFMAMRRAAILSGSAARSSKLARLADIVEEAHAEGLKVVVFSYFRDVLSVIGQMLPAPVFGPLTGSVNPSARFELIQEFSAVEGPAVLVSQIQAGGVGLNIQAASVVVITEPQWKPSTEEQAIARCHRMNQQRRVQVHRLLTRNSVDERITEILKEKAAKFDEYARKSAIKDESPVATAAHWEEDLKSVVKEIRRKSMADIVRSEQERLGVAVSGTIETAEEG